jgi:hypothetical protein
MDKVAEKHGIGKATVVAWAKELKSDRNRPNQLSETDRSVPEEARQRTFDEALETFLASAIGMLQAWAKECSDPGFIRENPTGVNALGASVLDRAERILANIRDTRAEEKSE